MDKFFLSKLLNLIYPPRCGYCNEITGTECFICERCRNLKTQKYINRCRFCGKISYEEKCIECRNKIIYYEELIFCSEYMNEIKHKIHLYKFMDKKFYYHFFTELLYEKLKEINVDFIIPVPISYERYIERGYNQSGLIAKKLSKFLNIPYCADILIKTQNSKRQSIQNFKERQESVKNVFDVADNNNVIVGKKILLIDDVFTTGATVNECSRVLKRAGVSDIKVAVISVSHMLSEA